MAIAIVSRNGNRFDGNLHAITNNNHNHNTHQPADECQRKPLDDSNVKQTKDDGMRVRSSTTFLY